MAPYPPMRPLIGRGAHEYGGGPMRGPMMGGMGMGMMRPAPGMGSMMGRPMDMGMRPSMDMRGKGLKWSEFWRMQFEKLK